MSECTEEQLIEFPPLAYMVRVWKHLSYDTKVSLEGVLPHVQHMMSKAGQVACARLQYQLAEKYLRAWG